MKDSDKLDAVGPSTIPHRMTDHQLQQLLAAKLPEKIRQIHGAKIYEFDFMWTGERDRGICDTEWEHIVRLVEEGMDDTTYDKYETRLEELAIADLPQKPAMTGNALVVPTFNIPTGRTRITSASWQQRATAMKECGII